MFTCEFYAQAPASLHTIMRTARNRPRHFTVMREECWHRRTLKMGDTKAGLGQGLSSSAHGSINENKRWSATHCKCLHWSLWSPSAMSNIMLRPSFHSSLHENVACSCHASWVVRRLSFHKSKLTDRTSGSRACRKWDKGNGNKASPIHLLRLGFACLHLSLRWSLINGNKQEHQQVHVSSSLEAASLSHDDAIHHGGRNTGRSLCVC